MSNEPVAGQWDFDRQRADDASGLEYTTFSVGVFQWLPAKRGLKKSRTIRVVGYVAEPERVFEEAEKLCRKLNDAKVDSAKPPAWVQKQYSVPRPANLVIERVHKDLTGSQVRSIRLAVMKRILLPEGFVKGEGGTYVRQQKDQIHLINFQAAQYGHSYTVNLGFHYAFLPGFFRHRLLSPAEYHLLDCAISDRIGGFIPPRHDVWYDYGDDKARLAKVMTENAELCLKVFSQYSVLWSDPAIWLTDVADDLILSPRKKGPWRATESLNFFRGCLAAHLKMAKRARKEFRDYIANASDEKWDAALRKCVKECCAALEFDPQI